MRDAAGELDDLKAALDVALGVGDDLAVLGREQLGQLVHIGLDQALELEHHPRAALGIGRGPAVEGGLGGLDRAIHLGDRGQLDPRLNLAGVGVEHVAKRPEAPVKLAPSMKWLMSRMIVANHPTGIADGIAVFDAVRARRADAIFFANADALRVSPRLGEAVIPVEWVVAKRTREKTRATLLAAKEAFEAERCVVLFPAGRLSRVAKDGSLTDPEWAATAASLARKYDAPVVPIHVAGPDSTLFHLFDRVSQELRDITLFHELLNKKRKAFQLKVGKPIPPSRLDIDAVKATYGLKAFTERVLPSQPDADFA
jgi:1-acyl-sn-glycerol-3-phosphate acyltransferase